MNRRDCILKVVASGLATAAFWLPAVSAQQTDPLAGAAETAGPVYAVPTTFDRAGRVLAPVMVNGQGPYRFILDTGANRAVLAPKVAAALGLVPSLDSSIGVHGVTGSAVLPAVEVERLQAGKLLLATNSLMPVLPEAVLANADGILGVQGLRQSRIDIDFRADRVTIERAAGRPAGEGLLTVPVTLRHGGLLIADARVGKVRVRVIIDTGAERTLGNAALREALGLTPTGGKEFAVTTVFGATPEVGEGTSLIAPTIYLGAAELMGLEVTFADLHVFRIWGLDKQPALLLGMDLLGTLQRLVIDYRRREVHLQP